MNIPKIGITLGDPGGIGPEIVLKALSSKTSLPKVSANTLSRAPPHYQPSLGTPRPILRNPDSSLRVNH